MYEFYVCEREVGGTRKQENEPEVLEIVMSMMKQYHCYEIRESRESTMISEFN